MEYANAAITIGGKIKGSDVEKLAQAIADDGAGIDWSDALDVDDAIGEIGNCSVNRRHLSLMRSEQPWGRFEAVETVCGELGLIYVAECEAGGEWHPMLTFRQPEMGTRKAKVPVYRDGEGIVGEQDLLVTREWPITEIGRGPLLDATDIQKHLDAGTLVDELALMVQVHKFPWPLEIVDDEPDFAEATRAVVKGAPAQQGACILTAENMHTADDCTMHNHELPARGRPRCRRSRPLGHRHFSGNQ